MATPSATSLIWWFILTKQEQLQKIIAQWQNPNEFLKYVWVEETGRGAVRFQRWPHLIDLFETILNNRLTIIMKARQLGVSWTLAAYCCWRMVSRPMSRVLVISKGDDEARYFLSHVKFIYTNLLTGTDIGNMTDLWPLSPSSSESIGVVFNKSGIGSQVLALPCTGTAGTGYTATDVICDEYDKWRTAERGLSIQERNYSAIKPPIDRTGGNLIINSTTEILEPESFFKRLWRGDNGFVKRFYGVEHHPMFSDEWFEQLCQEYEGSDYQRRQNYPKTEEEALTPPGEERIFPGADQLQVLSRSEVWTQEKPWVHVLHPFISGWRYVAGADVASGHGEDYSVLTIIGMKGLDSKTVAVIRSKDLTTYQFAQEIYALCERYHFPLLAVERNAMGVSVVDDLIAMRYPRLYFKDENARKNGKPGVDTGQLARLRGINETGESWIWSLSEAINSGILRTTFPPQVEELRDFFWVDGAAKARGNDDTVMSLAIANLLRKKNVGAAPSFVKLGGRKMNNTLVRT